MGGRVLWAVVAGLHAAVFHGPEAGLVWGLIQYAAEPWLAGAGRQVLGALERGFPRLAAA